MAPYRCLGVLLSLMTAAFTISATAAPAVPSGYEPLVSWRLCPPGGIYLEVMFWAVDCVNDVVQTATFMHHGDYWFAGACTFLIGLTILVQWVFVGQWPWKMARDSVKRGMDTEEWFTFKYMEQFIEAAGTGFIAPYGMTLTTNLGLVAAASAILGIFFSAKALTTATLNRDSMEKQLFIAVKAIKPRHVTIVSLWFCVASASEIGCFALAASILHPIIVFPFFFINMFANAWRSDAWVEIICANISPRDLVFGVPKCNLFGLLQVGDLPMAQLPHRSICATTVRLLGWCMLACTVDLPHGIKPVGSLGREMGAPVLWAKYWAPTEEVVTAAQSCIKAALHYVSTHTSADLQCSMPSSDKWSIGTMAFRAFLLSVVVLFTPIYLIGSILILALKPDYRNGVPDATFTKEVTEKMKEIEEWADAREQEYEMLE